MSAKVVHLPEDVHRSAKEYCEKSNIPMTKWVSDLIRDAVSGKLEKNNSKPAEIVFVKESAPPVIITPVEKGRVLEDLAHNDNESDVGSRPPFWAGRSRQE